MTPPPDDEPRAEVGGRIMERSLEGFAQVCSVHLAIEARKASPDNGLIAVLCDGIRLTREVEDRVKRLTDPPSSVPTEETTPRVPGLFYGTPEGYFAFPPATPPDKPAMCCGHYLLDHGPDGCGDGCPCHVAIPATPPDEPLAERYARMGTAPWFRAAHEGQSLGEAIPVAPDEPLDAETEALMEKWDAYWNDSRSEMREFVREVRRPVERARDDWRRRFHDVEGLRGKANVREVETGTQNHLLRARVADLEQRGEKLAETLRDFAVDVGPQCRPPCPADDTCDCEARPLHERVNAALSAWAARGTR